MSHSYSGLRTPLYYSKTHWHALKPLMETWITVTISKDCINFCIKFILQSIHPISNTLSPSGSQLQKFSDSIPWLIPQIKQSLITLTLSRRWLNETGMLLLFIGIWQCMSMGILIISHVNSLVGIFNFFVLRTKTTFLYAHKTKKYYVVHFAAQFFSLLGISDHPLFPLCFPGLQ